MDSLRSTHARVAALARRRMPDDPELVAAREELAYCLKATRALREQLGSVPPDAWSVSPPVPLPPRPAPVPRAAPVLRPAAPEPEPDPDAREALNRVVDLATRWTRIPARCHAGLSVLAVARSKGEGAAHV